MYIQEEKFEDTKGVSRSHRSKVRQDTGQRDIQDTKGVTRSHRSKVRQDTGQRGNQKS
jgi:hypothetical protein